MHNLKIWGIVALLICTLLLSGCKSSEEVSNQVPTENKIFSFNFSNDARYIIGSDDEDNTLYGYMDRNGKVVIKPQYNQVYDFEDGAAIVGIDVKGQTYFGMIDTSGKYIVEPEYDSIENFSEDLAVVVTDGKAGFVNKKGKIVIWPKYDNASSFQNGLAKVIVDDKVGFINKNGEYAIYPKYNIDGYLSGFKDGYAVVKRGDKYILIDKNDKTVKEFEYNYIFELSKSMYLFEDKNGKFGILSSAGEILLQAKYDSLKVSSDEKYIAYGTEDSWGIMDRAFKIIIPAEYETLQWGDDIIVANGYTAFNSKGKELFESKYEIVEPISDGLMMIQNSSGLFGFIDKTGKEVISPKYYSAESFKNKLTYVTEFTKDKKITGYINTSGGYVWKREKHYEGDEYARYYMNNDENNDSEDVSDSETDNTSEDIYE